MRKLLIAVSLLSLFLLGAWLLCNILAPATIAPSTILALPIIIGVPVALVEIGILFIYMIRQFLAQEPYLKRQCNKEGAKTNWQLLWRKDTKSRPYKREALLQAALFLSIVLIALSHDTIALFLPSTIPPPPGLYTPQTYQQQQEYERYERLKLILDAAEALSFPTAILIYACLSKDLSVLAKKSQEKIVVEKANTPGRARPS
jgi:hypothetical protein